MSPETERRRLSTRVQAAVDSITAAERLMDPGRDGHGFIEALKVELANLVIEDHRASGVLLPEARPTMARAGLPERRRTKRA